MRTKLLIAAAAAGMVFCSQAYADGGAYNSEPSNSYNALAAGSVDLSGATLNTSQLSQSVSGVSVAAPTGSLAAGGSTTAGIQGSTLSNTAGVIVQSQNSGIASNLGVASTISVGAVSVK